MGAMKERMLRGELYRRRRPRPGRRPRPVPSGSSTATTPPATTSRPSATALLRELLGSVGEGVVVKPAFRCDYGTYVSIGDGSFLNYDCVMLDIAPIAIGARCWLASCVQLLAATHPIDPIPRRDGWEYGAPITLADNVWLGGGVIVCPGVTIGEHTVVGAGAVVTRDLPAGVVAYGNPARVVREIGERDRVQLP